MKEIDKALQNDNMKSVRSSLLLKDVLESLRQVRFLSLCFTNTSCLATPGCGAGPCSTLPCRF